MTKHKSGKSGKYSNNECREVTVYQKSHDSDNFNNDGTSTTPCRDFYEVLEVDKRATTEEIRAAYKQLARRYHPDKNKGNEQFRIKFIEVKRAYEVLTDPEKRVIYDRLGMKGLDLAEQKGEHSQTFMARFISNPLYCCLFGLISILTCCCCCGCCCMCCCCCGTLHNQNENNTNTTIVSYDIVKTPLAPRKGVRDCKIIYQAGVQENLEQHAAKVKKK